MGKLKFIALLPFNHHLDCSIAQVTDAIIKNDFHASDGKIIFSGTGLPGIYYSTE